MLPGTTHVVFRVAGKQPELWDAVTGRLRDLPDCRDEKGRTLVPLQFAPRQSWFVLFRKKNSGTGGQGSGKNFSALRPVSEVMGPWEVSFDPGWCFGPAILWWTGAQYSSDENRAFRMLCRCV